MFGKDDNKGDPYGNTNLAYAVTDAEPITGTATTTNGSNPFEVKKQPTKCRDPIFAVLFYANVAAIIGVFIAYSGDVLNEISSGADDANAQDAGDAPTTPPSAFDPTTPPSAFDYEPPVTENALPYSGIVYTGLTTAAFATVLSAVMMQVMTCIPGILIKAALIFNVALAGAFAVFGFLSGNMFSGIIGVIFFALMLCYAKLVWSRIPFATANLKTACAIIRSNCGVTIVGYVFTIVAFAWTVLWSLAFAGVQDKVMPTECANGDQQCTTNPSYGLLFLLFLSLFFTHQVLSNCIHCTVAGVAGSWWFNPSSVGCCSSAVIGSLVRTLTTSFGSICFGSLLVAIIQALRQLAEAARQNDDFGNMLACCIDCILSCLQSIIEYFNKWAFVYVGLYGYSYCEAGKGVMDLFRDRGWEAIIADDLVGTYCLIVLNYMSLCR